MCRSALLAASVITLLAVPGSAAARLSSPVATVQLTVTMAPGVRLAPAAGPLGAATPRSHGAVTVNAPYRLSLRSLPERGTPAEASAPSRVRALNGTEQTFVPGSTIALVDDGQPGAVPLDAVREVLENLKRGDRTASAWVELSILPAY